MTLLEHSSPTASSALQCIVIETSDEQTLRDLAARTQLPILVLLPDYQHATAARFRSLGAFDVLPTDNAAIDRSPTPRRWRQAIVGQCPAIEVLADAIALIAERRSTVLITGETGTGKEVVARALHQASGRKGPMVSINCTALPESLLEAELFGHTKGAFTGAQSARTGLFEAANHGTIFLDEIGDMPLELQAKLLRVLQERQIQRLGATETIAIDARVIAATNVDLLSKVEDGRFREDLYFRLNVVPLHLPPLRERKGDLVMLARHFVEKICTIEKLPLKKLSLPALLRLEEYHWPGNIRELENTIERAIALSGNRLDLLPGDFLLPIRMRAKAPMDYAAPITIPENGLDFTAIIESIERGMIEQALQRTKGNKSAAAELLQLKRTTLGAKMQKLSA
ncbi:sigma-54 interaction domain-containing protein [Bryobacter aggregatus]|uniref:sigma-54 interaction domain-containing protein n=1 Tax=Bryobacter aggregatus TaxID=360054 RepID=UPI0006907759|nr:sigma 54-interacting transcriptional regulator [Bryobacter aggregatus]